MMDETDQRLVAELRRDGRAALSDLAERLGLSRATVRARMERLTARGDIAGFTVLTRGDVTPSPVRGLMMIGIEGRGGEKIMARLGGLPQVQAVHSTNGRWDVRTWVFIPPFDIAAREQEVVLANRTERAASGLLCSLLDEAKRRAADPDQIAGRHLFRRRTLKAFFLLRRVGGALVDDHTVRQHAGTRLIGREHIFEEPFSLLLREVRLLVAPLIFRDRRSLQCEGLDLG
ncbi:MAG: Lrp/AsnC family transcriptional regulator [Hyphomonas sp.]|nr:Lrp/AsnC family transcriptional regulator [Hyphomonas sp.]